MKFGSGTLTLDRIDYLLLDALQHDAKISLKRIGEQVGLSAPSVLERVRKLEQAGAIRGYFAELDGRKVGIDVGAFIGVTIRNPPSMNAFEQWVVTERLIQECHHVTGGFSLVLKVKAPTTSDLEQLIRRIRSLEGVERTETMVVLSSTKEQMQIALEIPEEEEGPRERRSRRRASP